MSVFSRPRLPRTRTGPSMPRVGLIPRLVAALAVVALAAAAYAFWPQHHSIKVTGEFTRAVGLFPGSDVRILGRQSVDVIKSGGFKISAREIEDVIARHENVREVAVLGVPDRVWGERIVAAVVLRGGSAAAAAAVEAEISDLCRQCLADYKRPREVRILEELPRNALGKVQKHRIREELER